MAFLVIVEDGSFFAVTSCRRATDTPGARLSAKGSLLQELHCMLERDIVSVSFSHLSDETWVAATSAACLLGMDAARASEFGPDFPLGKVFHPQELAAGHPPARLWAMKEAVAKARGCGFDGLNPLDITLRPDLGLAWIHNEETIPFHIWSRRQETDTWIALAYADIIHHFPIFVGNKEGK